VDLELLQASLDSTNPFECVILDQPGKHEHIELAYIASGRLEFGCAEFARDHRMVSARKGEGSAVEDADIYYRRPIDGG